MKYDPTFDIIAVVLIVSVASLVAQVCCRLLRRRGRRASWLLAVPIAITIGILHVLTIYCIDQFRGKTPLSSYALPVFTIVSIVALLPTLLVICMERRRFRSVVNVA
jgi:uncharacterized membrane protein YedE/YeeE